MARTQLTSTGIRQVQRNDLDVITSGEAVVAKLIAGTNITFSSTGVDAGTGDVTINASSSGGSNWTPVGADIYRNSNVMIGAAEAPTHKLEVHNGPVLFTNGTLPYTSPYGLSIQSNSAGSWIEILNNAGADKGAFFGLTVNDFSLYNYQGGPIKFFTSLTPTSSNLRFTIGSDGTVTVNNLSGSGTRMVVADPAGLLSTQAIPGGGSGTPGGADGQVQYNNGGVFGGDAAFNWDDTNKYLGIGTAVPENRLHVVSSNNAANGIVVDNTSTGTLATSRVLLRNNAGESAQIVINGSNTGAPNVTYMSAGKDLLMGVDHAIASGGSSKFQIYTGGYNNSVAPQFTIDNLGRIISTPLDTDLTAPVQTGTIRMVTTDSNGLLSFQAIPGGGTGSPGGSNGYVQFNDGGLFGGDPALFWDNTNKRLGIGIPGPIDPLHIYKDQNAPTTLRITNHTDGPAAQSNIALETNAGLATFFKVTSAYAGYKNIGANDFGLYNTSGNISFMNDNPTGNINFATGTATSAVVTISNTTLSVAPVSSAQSITVSNFGIQSFSPDYTFLGRNLVYNGTDWKYLTNGYGVIQYYALGALGTYMAPENVSGPGATGSVNFVHNIANDGEITFAKYGLNTFAGTPTYALGVDIGGNVVEFPVGGGGGGTPAGANKQIQFNNSGAFGADTNFVWDSTNKRLGVGQPTPQTDIHILHAANNVASVVVENTSTGNAAQSRFALLNDFAESTAITLYGNGVVGAPNRTYFTTSRDLVINTDNGLSSGGTSKFQVATGGMDNIGTPKFTIDGVGNVGIGTVSPATTLHISSHTPSLPTIVTGNMLIQSMNDGMGVFSNNMYYAGATPSRYKAGPAGYLYFSDGVVYLGNAPTGAAGSAIDIFTSWKLLIEQSGNTRIASLDTDLTAPTQTGTIRMVTTDSNGLLSHQAIPSGGGGGITTIGTIGTVPNSGGASISGATLTLQPASQAFGGVVNTSDQTFEGFKTFNSGIRIGTTANFATVLDNIFPGRAGLYSGVDTAIADYNTTTSTFKYAGDNITFDDTINDLTINGNVHISSLETPGDTQMVTTDVNGFISYQAIPSGGGVTTVSNVGFSPNNQAAIITGTNLQLQVADVGFPGVVSTVGQTFTGEKTFASFVTIDSTVVPNASVSPAMRIYRRTSLPADNGIGSSIEFYVENSGGTAPYAGAIKYVLYDGTGASGSSLDFTTINGAGTPVTPFRLTANTALIPYLAGSGTRTLTVDNAGLIGASAGGGGGVTTMAPIGSVPNADGASISGSTLTLQPASASFGGVVTTAAQTFAGVKGFTTVVNLIQGANIGTGAKLIANAGGAGLYDWNDFQIATYEGASSRYTYGGGYVTIRESDGRLSVPSLRVGNLDTDLTPPTTSGTTKVLISDNDGVVSFGNVGGTLLNVRFLTSGTTYTPTAGTSRVVLHLIGGGGGGGGTAGVASGSGAGAGGGAGAYVIKQVTGITGTYTYAIGGAGNAGAATSGTGGTGGNTTFINPVGPVTYTAAGGVGGVGSAGVTTASFTVPVLGGNGGAATNGDVNIAGEGGGVGMHFLAATSVSGAGGSSNLGSGGKQLISTVSTAGVAGSGYGGGGGGGVSSGNTNAAGGAGATGAIVIYEYS